jgi:hypothetical protein
LPEKQKDEREREKVCMYEGETLLRNVWIKANRVGLNRCSVLLVWMRGVGATWLSSLELFFLEQLIKASMIKLPFQISLSKNCELTHTTDCKSTNYIRIYHSISIKRYSNYNQDHRKERSFGYREERKRL